ncbi:MAG: MFS transporter [Actinomycetota bacterium]|nr:MFS transporter [Actinomycetota bacterium]
MTTAAAIAAPPEAARLACFTAFGTQGFTVASLITRLPTIKGQHDLSDYQVLMLLGGVAIASAVGSVLAGYAAARFGSATVLRVALAGASVATLVVSFPESVPGLVIAIGAYGFFVGQIDAAMNMQGVGIEDLYGRSIMVGFHGMWSLGAVVGGGYAALTLELGWSFLPSFAIVCAVGLALNLVLLGDLLQVDPIDGHVDAGQHAPSVPWLPVLLLAVPTFVMWFLDSAISAWGSIYLVDGLSSSQSAAALAFTAYQAVLLVTRLVGDKVVRRIGPVRTVRISGLVAIVSIALVVAAPSVWVAIAGFGLLGAGLAMIPPLSFVAAGHLDADGGGQAVARVNVSNYVGYLVAAVAIATVAEQVNHRAMFVLPLLLTPVLVLMASRFAPLPIARERCKV